jgi:2Fe-2S ferredoxin
MPVIHYHHPDGHADSREVEAGTSVMSAAVNTGVDGIVGECGGQMMCSTCHVYVRDEYSGRLPEISEEEDEMLDATSAPRDAECSRLGCQLVMGDELDELHVDVPESQV